MKMLYRSLCVSLIVLPIGGLSADSPVVISEFIASNRAGLVDNFGDRPDWIEIRNLTATNVNLLNWSLTDNPGNTAKWQFPETNITAGGYMVIFASGRDLRVAGAPLHANFNLDAGGEYLALFQPNGEVATQFTPYLPQAPDVSFGFGLVSSNVTLITTNSAVRVRIPASGADGTNWTYAAFSDASWTSGVNGVGFGGASGSGDESGYALAVASLSPVAYWRMNENSGTTLANVGTAAAQDGTAQGGLALGGIGPRPPTQAGFESGNTAPTFNGTSSFVGAGTGLLSGRNTFTLTGWIKPAVTPGSRVGLFGQNDAVEFGFISGTTIQCWTPGGGSLNVTYTQPLNTWHQVVAVGDGTNIRIYVDGVQAGSGGTAASNYGSSGEPFRIGGGGIFDSTTNYFNGQIDEVAVFHRALAPAEITNLYRAGTNSSSFSVAPFTKTDVGPAMSNINASAYVRLPFTVADPTNASLLLLKVRHDDGFAAWINGVEVARVNAPDPLAWNSAATDIHSAVFLDEFRIGAAILLPGNNVLALQGLNRSASDPDFLVQAEMSATFIESEDPVANYLAQPTPGAANGAASSKGPLIRDVVHTPNVPTEDEDLQVTALVTRSFNPVATVTLFYRFMFQAETSTPMFDDGTHGDGLAGDGIFAATLPAAANATNSQMIRYYIRATDSLGQASRWPPFPNAASTEYLGTIVEPIGLTSKLPIVHLFAPTTVLGPGPTTTTTGADSQGGARGVSVFHDGEFYDNIHMQLRGNSTSGFNKKSHRLEFNSDHQFRHSGPGARLRKTSFVADYPDPTYMRQGIAYWLCELMGSPAPFYIPHRLQLNGAFYQLANHNDVHGEELLERLGYDPNGALYNAAGTVVPTRFSTGGFEKKTRKWDNDSDYAAMSAAIAETLALGLRETNFFELYDIPNALNYLVSARWFHENDDVWANMSLFHDNDGDNQWKIVPFDVNLSWGAIFYEGSNPSVIEGVQATNDIHKAHPLYGSSATPALNSGNYNRVYDTVFRSPVLRQMFLRRLRTLMDTYAQPPGTHPLARVFEKKVLDWRDRIAEEAARDRAKWLWPPKGGQCNFNPGILLHPGVDAMISEFIEKRRTHFFVKHSVTNASVSFPVGITKTDNAGIPLPQPANATITIAGVEYNPASGNQSQEYVILTNANSYAVDISGWTLSGGVEFTFHQGTVIPANRAAYLTPDVRAFRARTTGPRGGQGLFVIGPYDGQLSARGEGLAIHDTTGRLVHTNSYPGSPSLAQRFLRVTEIMYNPAPLSSNPGTDAQEFEYLELKNISATETLDLAGIRFVNGVEFGFSGSAVTSLAPGQRVLVVKNAIAFATKYGPGLPVAGQYIGGLDNGGERLRLLDSSNEEILDFRYNNNWYPITDGVGFSLVVVDENALAEAWGEKPQWRPSGSATGTPGQSDPPPVTFAPILINEVLSSSDASLQDYIELFNPTASDVNIGGWYISDDFTNAYKFRIPAGTIITAGGYQTFYEPQFNPTPGVPPSFSFSSRGDDAYIFSADAGGQLTGYIFGYEFGAAGTNVSFGRHLTSQTNLHFVAQSVRTPDAANATPKVGPVVISEIMYHPVDGEGGADNSVDEFIELRNLTGAAVNLFDPSFTTNTWRLRGGADFDLPENVTLPANGHLILANIDPSDAGALAAFRSRYNIPQSVGVLGPFSGKLDNSAESVRLLRPDGPEANEVPYVLVDEVDYADTNGWNSLADGTGASLQRVALNEYGNDPINWTAAAPTAGSDRSAGALPVILTQPSNVAGIASQSASFSVTASGTGLRYQWYRNGQAIPGAINSILALSNLQNDDAGQFHVVVYNNSGAVRSGNAILTILFAAYFSQHPASTQMFVKPEPLAAPTTNATFTIAAASLNPPLSYQWRANGVDIPGATGTSLTIVNVTTNDFAEYTCAVTDQAGTVVSQGAWLYPMVKPLFVYQPVSQDVPPNTPATLSVEVTGFPPPFTYEWRLGSVGVKTNIVDSTVNLFTIVSPSTLNNSNHVRVVVRNRANTQPGNPSTFADVTSVLDTDGDGIIDSLEDSIPGLNKDNAADAAADTDGDGMANGDEIIAGTDMNDANSYLKVTESVVPGLVTLTIATKAGRSYTVQYSDDLITWNKLADIAGRSTDQVRSVSDSSSQPHRFYRVAVPGQP